MYDIIIIGAGPSALSLAYKLSKKTSILMLDKGKPHFSRKSVISGLMGSHLHSYRYKSYDKKLNNPSYIAKAYKIISRILNKTAHSAEYYIFPNDSGFKIADYFYNKLASKITFAFDAEVLSITKINNIFQIITSKGAYSSHRCVIATGPHSFEWLTKICSSLSIPTISPFSKIGFRLEASKNYLSSIDISEDYIHNNNEVSDFFPNSHIYEVYGNLVYAKGSQLVENEKINMFVSTEVNAPLEEVIRTIKIINVLNNDRMRRERTKDFMNDKTSLTNIQLFSEFKSTLEALHETMPYLLDTSSIYTPEIKTYGILPVTSKFRTKIPKLYGVGECTNSVDSFLGAVASGLICAETIKEGL